MPRLMRLITGTVSRGGQGKKRRKEKFYRGGAYDRKLGRAALLHPERDGA